MTFPTASAVAFLCGLLLAAGVGSEQEITRCADEQCKEIVSIGRTTQRYFGRNGNMISFASDEIVNVYGKGKSDKDELLVVEIKGKRGLMNRRYYKEGKVLVRDPQISVPISRSLSQPATPPRAQVRKDLGAEEVAKPVEGEQDLPQEQRPSQVPQTPQADMHPSPYSPNLPGKPEQQQVGAQPSAPPSTPPTSGESSSEAHGPTPSHQMPEEHLSQPPPVQSSTAESLQAPPRQSPPPPPPSPPTPEIHSSMPADPLTPPSATSLLSAPERSGDRNLLGAHATQMSLSTEDMEYERLKSVYADADGEFPLESSLRSLASGLANTVAAIDAATASAATTSGSLLLPVSARESEAQYENGRNYEIFDGTTIPNDDVPTAINEAPKATEDPVPSISPTLTQPASTTIEFSEAAVDTFSEVRSNPPDVKESPETRPPVVDIENRQTEKYAAVHGEATLPEAPTKYEEEVEQQIENTASPGDIKHEDQELEQEQLEHDPQILEIDDSLEEQASNDSKSEVDSASQRDDIIVKSDATEHGDEEVEQKDLDAEDLDVGRQDQNMEKEEDEDEDDDEEDEEADESDGSEKRKRLIQEQLEMGRQRRQPSDEAEQTEQEEKDVKLHDEPTDGHSEDVRIEPSDEEALVADLPHIPNDDEVAKPEEMTVTSGPHAHEDSTDESAELEDSSSESGFLSGIFGGSPEAKPEPQVTEETPAAEASPKPEAPAKEEATPAEDSPKPATEETPEINGSTNQEVVSTPAKSSLSVTTEEVTSQFSVNDEVDTVFTPEPEHQTQTTETPAADPQLPEVSSLEMITTEVPSTESHHLPSGSLLESTTEAPGLEDPNLVSPNDSHLEYSTKAPHELPPTAPESQDTTTQTPFEESESSDSVYSVVPPKTPDEPVPVPQVPEDYKVPIIDGEEEVVFHDPYASEQHHVHSSQQVDEDSGIDDISEDDEAEGAAGGELPLPESEQDPDSGATSAEFETDVTETVEDRKGVLDETIEHYAKVSRDFLPTQQLLDMFLLLLGETSDSKCLSPRLLLIISSTVVLFVATLFVFMLVDQFSKEGPLKKKMADMEKELFQVSNESQIVKREAEQLVKSAGAREALPQKTIEHSPQLLKELDDLKTVNKTLQHQLCTEEASWDEERQNLLKEKQELELRHAQVQQELAESESIVQECLEDKKRRSEAIGDAAELSKAIETLRRQLSTQQEVVGKYEAKVKKRESELKEKTQELRRQRADTANAKLQVTKISNEKDELKKDLEALEKVSEEGKAVRLELQEVKQNHLQAVQRVEAMESELEAKSTEVEVLKLTVDQLKALTGSPSEATEVVGSGEGEDGWDCEDALVTPDLASIQENAQLRVDLRKAQEACERLSDQLSQAEGARDEFENLMKEHREEMEIARKTKEKTVQEKVELDKRLEVLTAYFNQRESDLQKQLGMTANRLSDTTSDGESAAKKLTALTEEAEVYKSQIKSMKKEMEEQERSLKAQNAALEKKHHESWVTVRQESRRSAEAQSEMQTLRARLTTVEGKLVEKEFEITSLKEENESLRETVEKISRSSLSKSEPVAGVTKSVSCSKVVSFSLMGRSKSEEKSKSSDDGKFGDDAFVTPDPTFLTNNDPAKSDEAASTALTDVYTNGNGSTSSSAHNDPLGISSSASANTSSTVPPDLPPLPYLPSLPSGPFMHPPMGGPPQPPPHHIPLHQSLPPFMDARPAPLGGRRSPPPSTGAPAGQPAAGGGAAVRGYSPSPTHSNEYYGGGRRHSRHHRDDSLTRVGMRSYDRYSRERSPDRVSNRSGRSDQSRYD